MSFAVSTHVRWYAGAHMRPAGGRIRGDPRPVPAVRGKAVGSHLDCHAPGGPARPQASTAGWEPMTIHRLLRSTMFDPETVAAMADAFEQVCRDLGLVERDACAFGRAHRGGAQALEYAPCRSNSVRRSPFRRAPLE